MGRKTVSTVSVNVTPLFQTGRQVICDIDPPPGSKKAGMVRLNHGNACTLEFNLQPGNPSPLAFRTDSDCFWWDTDDCPRNNANGCPPPYSNPRVDNGGSTLRIDVAPAPQNSAVHYRFNFDNNRYFDPIIIRD